MIVVIAAVRLAGGGAVFETVFDKDGSGEGIYAFVTHSFADADKGAVGMIQVGTPRQFAQPDRPFPDLRRIPRCL